LPASQEETWDSSASATSHAGCLLGPRARPPYNRHVARGWESKSVEAQQAEASEKPGIRRPPMSPAEAALYREVEGLRLSRRRIVQELSAQQASRHRKMLEQALADLDQKIAMLTVNSE
jgi:hypothetical protein